MPRLIEILIVILLEVFLSLQIKLLINSYYLFLGECRNCAVISCPLLISVKVRFSENWLLNFFYNNYNFMDMYSVTYP